MLHCANSGGGALIAVLFAVPLVPERRQQHGCGGVFPLVPSGRNTQGCLRKRKNPKQKTQQKKKQKVILRVWRELMRWNGPRWLRRS